MGEVDSAKDQGSGSLNQVILSARLLTTFQRCRRQYALEREYSTVRRRPRSLFEQLLRRMVFIISNGGSHEEAASEACADFMEAAASPGLDTPHDPYTLARDYVAIIQTVAEALSRTVLLTVQPAKPVLIGEWDEHEWKPDCFVDESGTLHRWVVVDKWTEDAKWRELQGWGVFGDCAALAAPMDLHVVEIGQTRGGHQHCHWCRAYKHPAILGRTAFQKRDGTPLEKSWKPIWYQDSVRNAPGSWVDQMQRDEVEMFRHVAIKAPGDEVVERFRRDMEVVSGEILRSLGSKWEDQVMERVSCNTPYVCPWQPVCYTPGLVKVEDVGFMRKA